MSEPPIMPPPDIDPIPGEVLEPDSPPIPGWEDAPVSGDRVNVFDAPIVAGDPAGARIEIRSTGFHAFNGVGTETAHIDGAEGVFVGGEFRTSDTLPGQVTLADNAYTHSTTGATYPGISIDPIDASLTATPPGIGSYGDGVIVDGGKATTGESSYIVANPRAVFLRSLRPDGTTGGVIQTSPEFSALRTYREDGATGGVIQATPDESLMRTYRADGTTGGEIQVSPEFSIIKTYRADGTTGGEIQTSPEFSVLKTYRADGGTGGEVVSSPTRSRVRTYSGNGEESGWMMAQPNSAEIASLDSSNAYVSQIKASATEAFLYASAGGTRRYLSVDADGVWVKTNKSGSFKNYNLEETAQDSGWVAFTPASGITANNASWRNKGGVMWFRGFVTASWVSGWNLVRAGFTSGEIPTFGVERPAWNTAGDNYGVRMRATGDLEVYAPTAGAATIRLDGLNYPTS